MGVVGAGVDLGAVGTVAAAIGDIGCFAVVTGCADVFLVDWGCDNTGNDCRNALDWLLANRGVAA